MPINRLTLILLMSIVFMQGSTFASDETDQELEHLLKAKVVHTISLFMEWPTITSSEYFSVCVLGKDSNMFDALKLIYQRVPTFNKKTVKLRSTSLKEADNCSMLFIPHQAEREVKQAITQLLGKPILIYADSEGFGELGTHVNLYVENKKVRFEVNIESSKKAGIVFSSQLLRLAKIVQTKE